MVIVAIRSLRGCKFYHIPDIIYYTLISSIFYTKINTPTAIEHMISNANCIELCFIMNSIIHITLVIAVNASVLNNSDIPYP